MSKYIYIYGHIYILKSKLHVYYHRNIAPSEGFKYTILTIVALMCQLLQHLSLRWYNQRIGTYVDILKGSITMQHTPCI